MVEPTGQPRTQLPGTEESKTPAATTNNEPSYMVGDQAAWADDLRQRLEGVEMNQLEEGLFNRFVMDPNLCREKIHDLLVKLETKATQNDDQYALKRLRKTIPLLMEHDFWSTQPVPKYFERYQDAQFNQPIECKTVDQVQEEPLNLPENYEWCTVSLEDDQQAEEVYQLLTNHYVEDSEGKFRFDYSIPFIRWALMPPNFVPEWVIGVRGQGKLCGFISGIPVTMSVNGQTVQMAEVNFLCVHKNLREKRLAPTLIKELTRRVNCRDQWQAIYTSGTTLPTPFATAQYWHRNLDPKKLVECKFAFKPADITMPKFVRKHRLQEETFTPGLRPMVDSDVPKVAYALNKHLSENYAVHIEFNEQEIKHFFLPQPGVVNSYLVEDEHTGEVSDFISFYTLNSSVLDHPKHTSINAAYAYYNFVLNNEPERMNQLMRDALILAKQAGFDVFNMTEVLKHSLVKNNLMFKPGDGRLAHYLYNWRVKSITSDKIGIVLV